jgi:hypothetical protein
MNNRANILFWALITLFAFGAYFFIGEMLKFSEERSPLVFELFAAIMGSIVTVSAMTVMMRAQVKHERDKEYSIYQDLMSVIFAADDDNVIQIEEIQEIENKVGVACLVANEKLVSTFSQFLYQLKIYGTLYFRSLNEEQLAHFTRFVVAEAKAERAEDSKLANDKYRLKVFLHGNVITYFVSLDNLIQAMRVDLAVVEGDVRQEIEHFVRTPYNKYNLIRDPNLVDPE